MIALDSLLVVYVAISKTSACNQFLFSKSACNFNKNHALYWVSIKYMIQFMEVGEGGRLFRVLC
jgi:hypothetical protein